MLWRPSYSRRCSLLLLLLWYSLGRLLLLWRRRRWQMVIARWSWARIARHRGIEMRCAIGAYLEIIRIYRLIS